MKDDNGWLDVASAPTGESVLVCVASTAENRTYGENGHRQIFQAAHEDGAWHDQGFDPLENKSWIVTHWKPLGELPRLPTRGV